MNARLLTAFLCIAMAGSGCIIVDEEGGGGGRPGGPCCTSEPTQPTPQPQTKSDITFLWTFANVGAGRCEDVPDVKSIRITIPGEKLHNGGIYPCKTEGTDGIVLHDFVADSYAYTLEALSYGDKVLYEASGKVQVNGNVRETVNLTPRGSPSSFAYLSWTFEENTSSNNPDCNQAGDTHVDVRIDGGPWTRYVCEKGLGNNQVSSIYLQPGDHIVEFVGVRVASGAESIYYYRKGALKTQAGSPIVSSYKLLAVGGMSLRWELLDGTAAKTCAQSGVTSMRINMQNLATKELVYGNDGDAQRCDGAPILYPFLRPGDYRVYVRGLNGTQTTYTNESDAPVLTVKAFVQKKDTDAVTLEARRK